MSQHFHLSDVIIFFHIIIKPPVYYAGGFSITDVYVCCLRFTDTDIAGFLKIILAFFILICYTIQAVRKYPDCFRPDQWRVVRDGRRSTIGNRVNANPVSRVRIPHSPLRRNLHKHQKASVYAGFSMSINFKNVIIISLFLIKFHIFKHNSI